MKVSGLVCLLLFVSAFALATPGESGSMGGSGPGTVFGEGTCFEVTNSTYLNVSLCSSVVVHVTLESVPDVVSFTMETNTSEAATEIEMGGFEPNATYYRHEDGHLKETFVADGNGNHTYTQDLSAPHHVFIQEEAGTKYIRDAAGGGDCASIGTWDAGSLTCTLTTDLTEMVVIDSPGITLEGDGHSITKGTGSYGVYIVGKLSVAVRNVTISGFTYGISSSGSPLLVIDDNLISGCYAGIYVSGRWNYPYPKATVSNNTVSGSAGLGIQLAYLRHAVLSNNSVSGNGNPRSYGIRLFISPATTMRDNVVSGFDWGFGVIGTGLIGNEAHYGHDIDTSNTVEAKPIYYWVGRSHETVPSDAGYIGIVLSDNITVEGHSMSGNVQGVLFAYTTDSVVRDLTVTKNMRGIELVQSPGNVIENNTLFDHLEAGVSLYYSDGNRLENNSVEGSEYRQQSGIGLGFSDGNVIRNNALFNNSRGIYLSAISADNALTGNQAFNNTVGIFIYLAPSNTLRDNVMTDNAYNFGVGGNVVSRYVQDIDTSNTVDGKPIYYWVGRDNETVPMDAGYVGIVNSENITVEGLTITNNSQGVLFAGVSDSTVRNMNLTNNGNGVLLIGSVRNTISGNTGRMWYGIILDRASNFNTVSGNNLPNAYRGLIVTESSYNTLSGNDMSIGGSGRGIELNYGASGNTVSGNNVTGPGRSSYASGIYMYCSYRNCGDNSITGNSVTVFWSGITIGEAVGNTINGNFISDNRFGFHLREADGNHIHHNNIVGNINQLYNDQSTNTWDDGAGEGNYWSDYTGADDGSGDRVAGDGVGDTDLPHLGVDWYPLMEPWDPDPIDAIQKLKQYILDQDLHKGTETSFLSQLTSAESALGDGNLKRAVQMLEAFLHHVDAAEKSGKLTPEQADYIRDKTEAIIFLIEYLIEAGF